MKILVSLLSLQMLMFCSCHSKGDAPTQEEQDKLFSLVIQTEIDSSLGSIRSAKYGSFYLVKDEFIDSLYLEEDVVSLLERGDNILDQLRSKYKKFLRSNGKVLSDSFHLLRPIGISNKTPVFLSFSKPMKYENFYLINFSLNSSSSGYTSLLIFSKDSSSSFRLIYRVLLEVV